jgi:DNA-binding SARP family transcriptional activator
VGGRQVAISAGKQRVVLATLLLNAGQVVPLDNLAEAVWGAAIPASARMTLRNYVKRLRQALADADRGLISTGQDGYRIDADASELDVARFGTLLKRSREAARSEQWSDAAAILREALSLRRGQPLADVPSELLLLQHGPWIAEMYTQALETRIDADLHLGRYREVITELRQFTAAHPLLERPHGMLMLALYHDGRPAEALAAYQNARRAMMSELGIEPGPELRQLHLRILRADPGLVVPFPRQTGGVPVTFAGNARHSQCGVRLMPVPRQLPACGTHFVGRTAELALLRSLLDNAGGAPALTSAPRVTMGKTLLVAIAGTAGVGKTALALHFTHLAADRYPDGQLYVNLRGFDPLGEPLRVEAAMRTLLDALHVRPSEIPAGIEAQAGLYRSMLAGRRMLIMLDNAASAAQVRLLLPGSGECLVVVTSRRQLTALAAAEGAHTVTLDAFTDSEAHEFLASRLGAAQLAAEPGAARELTAACARLPLALSIVTARAAARPGFPLAMLAAELRDPRRRLDALDGGEATANVRDVFSWSYHQLPSAAARMFCLLGLHPGPDITVLAAAGLAGVRLDQARQALVHLTAGCLLTEHTPGRYAFHGLLRAYAAEQAGRRHGVADGSCGASG